MSSKNSPSQSPSPAANSAGEPLRDRNVEDLTALPAIPASRYELRILQALRRIVRNIEIHSHRLGQKHQITGPQLACLLAVIENGPLTVTALSDQVFLSPSTVVGIVDRLESKRLLKRKRSSRDRRKVLVVTTETGRRLAEEAPTLLQHALAEKFKKLPEPDQISITLALEKVVDMMEAREIEAAPVLEIGPIAENPLKMPQGHEEL
jgi:DNA-binding MarR family transcriptional regulator